MGMNKYTYEIKEQKSTEEPRNRGSYTEDERARMYKALDTWHDIAEHWGTKITLWHNDRLVSSYDQRPIEEREQ